MARCKKIMITCPFCGALCTENDILICPECNREGCCGPNGGCMPAGKMCMCPQCEEGDGEDD